MTPSPFYKPQFKPDCSDLRLVSQRHSDPAHPMQSQVDTYLFCNTFQRKIKKVDCVDCEQYKLLKRSDL